MDTRVEVQTRDYRICPIIARDASVICTCVNRADSQHRRVHLSCHLSNFVVRFLLKSSGLCLTTAQSRAE